MDRQYDGINITVTWTVIDIQEVAVPAAIVTTHAKKALSAFGTTPFTLVCLRSHLHTDSLFTSQNPPQASPSDSLLPESLSSNYQSQCSSRLDLLEAEWDSTPEPESNSDSNTMLLDMDAPLPNSPPLHVPDPASQEEGQKMLQSIATVPCEPIQSQVLKDPYHIFSMPYISWVHGVQVEYCHRFRNAMLIPYRVDMCSLIAWGKVQNPPLSWDKMVQQMPAWLWKRCHHFIPPPEELYHRVKKVFETYGPLKDAKTSQPLFNAATWHDAKNILALIQSGCLSDPQGIALYVHMRTDKHGLPVYHCL